MNIRRLCAALLVAGIPLVGCGEHPGRIDRVTAPAWPRTAGSFVSLDSLEYEVFSGTLMPGMGGALTGYARSWGPKCAFTLIVPASSMPDQGPPFPFTMSVPKKQSYDKYSVDLDSLLIVRLAPDGEAFIGPITIIATWMPWEGVPPDTLVVHSGSDTTLAITQYNPTLGRYQATFSVHHFSDWEAEPEPRRNNP